MGRTALNVNDSILAVLELQNLQVIWIKINSIQMNMEIYQQINI